MRGISSRLSSINKTLKTFYNYIHFKKSIVNYICMYLLMYTYNYSYVYICTYICEYNYISIFLSFFYLNSVAFDIFLVENYFFIKSFFFSVCDTLAALNVFINLFLKIPLHSPVFFVNWFSYPPLSHACSYFLWCHLPFPRIFSFFHFMLKQEPTHPNLSFSTLQPNFLD